MNKQSSVAPPCPCGHQASLDQCCGPYLEGLSLPQTAEQLMRSRYSAYKLQKIDYLRQTLWPKYQPAFDAIGVARWAAENFWTGLAILSTDRGQQQDRQGTVLFEATYLANGQLNTHREHSLFRKKAGRWYYVEAIDEG